MSLRAEGVAISEVKGGCHCEPKAWQSRWCEVDVIASEGVAISVVKGSVIASEGAAIPVVERECHCERSVAISEGGTTFWVTKCHSSI